jgi:hypothetical protein
MKLTQLTEQKERPYLCFHVKKGKHETHAPSSYDAAKNAAEHWGLKSTAGITVLADVEHVAEEVITEGPCDIAKPEEIKKMSGEEYDKYAQWKKDCEAEERTAPLSTKRLESFDDYHGDMSQEEYDQEVDNSQMEYAVWVGGTEVNDKWLTYDEAIALYDKYKAQGYDDIKLDARLKEGSFWGRDDMVKKMKDGEKASGMKKFVKIDDKGNHHGTTTSDKAKWKELIAQGYEEDKDYFKEEVQSGPKAEVGMKMKRMLGDEITIGTITKVSPEGVDVKFEDGKTVTYNDGYYDWSNDKEVPFITYESAKPDFLDLDKDGDKKEPMKKAVKDKKRTDEIFPLALGGMAGALMADRKAKRDAEQLNAEEGDDSEEAVAARDEFLKVMDMKPKSSNKAIDTIKKIVADKQNQQVKFDDGKMKVDLYTASAISQVYDAVKPETQEKIDNMLKTKEGMLKLSNFAFSKISEGLKEGKQLDEILPIIGAIGGAIARGVGSAAAKAVGKAAVKTAIKHPIKTAHVAGTVKNALSRQQPQQYESEEDLEELQAPYTGADGIKDRNGKMHKPGSSKANMIVNMKKKVAPAKKAGVGRGNAPGSKATQIKPGVKANTSGVKKPAVGSVKMPTSGQKNKSTLGKIGNAAGAAGKYVKDKVGGVLAYGGASSGFGNPLSASKQYADDMVEKAKRDAEEIEEISIRPAPKFKVSGPHGQKPGSHHPPAKEAPRFKASVKF